MITRDINTSIVSSISPMAFRQFLPHERRAVRIARRRDDREDIQDDTPAQATPKLPGGLLSSADIGVLFEAAEHINENVKQSPEQADELHMPLAFAQAARN